MAQSKDKKYKLLKVGGRYINGTKDTSHFYQLEALRDIPEHEVKAGDKGGYVTRANTLSHEGSCWIGEEAQVMGRVYVSDDAYIGGRAVVHHIYSFFDNYKPGDIYIKENARIIDNAYVSSHRPSQIDPMYVKTIKGNAHIFGEARLKNVRNVSGDVQIYDRASLNGVNIVSGSAKIYGEASLAGTDLVADNVEIYGQARIGNYGKITGSSKIFETAKLEDEVEVKDSIIAGNTHILSRQRVFDGRLNETRISSTLENAAPAAANAEKNKSEPSKINSYVRAFNEIQDNISSYETDIVKIIKYPVMTDRTNPFTQEMVLSLNIAKRLVDEPDSSDFKAAVRELEKAFLAAESNAIKATTTGLSESEKKKTEKAKDLLRIASNDASTEQEKKSAFVQGFKQLEGIITVPEIAMDTFRVKIGLKEIEA